MLYPAELRGRPLCEGLVKARARARGQFSSPGSTTGKGSGATGMPSSAGFPASGGAAVDRRASASPRWMARASSAKRSPTCSEFSSSLLLHRGERGQHRLHALGIGTGPAGPAPALLIALGGDARRHRRLPTSRPRRRAGIDEAAPAGLIIADEPNQASNTWPAGAHFRSKTIMRALDRRRSGGGGGWPASRARTSSTSPRSSRQSRRRARSPMSSSTSPQGSTTSEWP
jgi:hypothetical protein